MKKEMIKMDKQAKSDLVVVGLFLVGVVVLLGFVFASTFTSFNGATNFTLREDVYDIVNISVNLTLDASNNVTWVNITFPVGVSLNLTSNASSLTKNMSYDSVNRILTFFNDSRYILMNSTLNNGTFWVNISAATAGNFNITIDVYNKTSLITRGNISLYVNDSSYPTGISTTSLVVNGNYSGNVVLNFSITEDLPDTVIFNITNSAGVQNQTLTASRQGSTSYYNATMITSTLPDGLVILIVQVNDTLMGTSGTDISLSNRSWNITFRVDDTSPSVVLTSSSATIDTLVLTSTVTDATLTSSSCTIDRSGASVTAGSGTNVQTITESGLACGTPYNYIVTCTDSAGNSGSSSSTSFSTTDCSSSGVSSGGSSSTSWSMTYSPLESELVSTEGYTKEMKVKERIKVEVYSEGFSSGSKETHYVGIKEIKSDSVVVEVASTPIEVELNAGEDVSVDVNEDGYYDVYVKLNEIVNNKADLTIMKVYEEVPVEAEGSAVETSGEIVTSGEVPDEEKSAPWMIIIIVLVILAATIGGGVAWKNR